jgi:hypothetical protein
MCTYSKLFSDTSRCFNRQIHLRNFRPKGQLITSSEAKMEQVLKNLHAPQPHSSVERKYNTFYRNYPYVLGKCTIMFAFIKHTADYL